MSKYQTTEDVELEVAKVSRSWSWGVSILVALGWLALFVAASESLLAAIQVGMIGLGFIGTAIVASLWRRQA